MSYLDKSGLSHFYLSIKNIFSSKSEVEELRARVKALEDAMGGLKFVKSNSAPVTSDDKTITFVVR